MCLKELLIMKTILLKQFNAVIGNPLGHSLSPALHNLIYRLMKINAMFLPIAHPDVKVLVSVIRTLPIKLTAVTMPHKQAVMPFLDEIAKSARQAGAVNTVINKQGRLIGYNTDIFGLSFAFRNTALKNKKVLLIGAGGAAYAVASVVAQKGGRLIYLDRTAEKAKALQKKFGGKIVKLKSLKAADIDVIINATPVGMGLLSNHLPIPAKLLAPHQTVFDLVYNPAKTKLLRAAEKIGAKTILGLEMFVAQGLKQEELFLKKKIVSEKIVSLATKELVKQLNYPHPPFGHPLPSAGSGRGKI